MTNGSRIPGGGKYKITASNRKAGRGASADLVFVDELREIYEWDAWARWAPPRWPGPAA